jgi:hypothetical protein
MILYNVTLSLDPAIQDEWLNWMRTTHIPDVLKTACFTECRLSRVQGEEEGGVTYSVMYFAPNQELYDIYQREHAPLLQAEHSQKYAGRFAAFRTILTVIEEFK